MRTRSLLTTLACTAVLVGVGAGAETAFAESAPTTTASPVPSTPSTPPPSMITLAPPTTARSAAPATTTPPAPSRQITAVPSGAPNTGVPAASKGHGEAEAIGASLVVLLGGSGTVMLRRRLKGRG